MLRTPNLETLPNPLPRNKRWKWAIGQFIRRHRQQLFFRDRPAIRCLEVRSIEGRDADAFVDRLIPSERIVEVAGWNNGVAQFQHVDVSASPDSFYRIPYICIDAGSFVSDDQDVRS